MVTAYDDTPLSGWSSGQGQKYLKGVGRVETTIELGELVAMFNRAARNGAIPDAAILGDYPLLRSFEWAQTLAKIDTPLNREQFVRQIEMRKSLEKLRDFLPGFIAAKTFVSKAGLPGFGQDEVDTLIRLETAISEALPAFPASEGTRSTNWHTVAAFVAFFAASAFTRAGRTRIGLNRTSPLVKFIREWLGHAGITVSPENIATSFQSGAVRILWKSHKLAD